MSGVVSQTKRSVGLWGSGWLRLRASRPLRLAPTMAAQSEDWYSYHQQTISRCLRLQRAKNYATAIGVFANSTEKLFCSSQFGSAFDLMERMVAVFEELGEFGGIQVLVVVWGNCIRGFLADPACTGIPFPDNLTSHLLRWLRGHPSYAAAPPEVLVVFAELLLKIAGLFANRKDAWLKIVNLLSDCYQEKALVMLAGIFTDMRSSSIDPDPFLAECFLKFLKRRDIKNCHWMLRNFPFGEQSLQACEVLLSLCQSKSALMFREFRELPVGSLLTATQLESVQKVYF